MPNAQPLATERAAALDTALTAVVNDPVKPLASLSVLAIKDGAVVYEGQFGNRVWSVNGNSPADRDTLYRMASISKMVTAIGAMRLVDDGKLDLDADIGTYLGYAVRNPHFPTVAITARMLLSHTSSLRDDAGYFWPLDVSLRDVLQPGGKHYGAGSQWVAPATGGPSPVSRQPGAYFQYVNLNFGVLGTVMEAITGERFDQLMPRLVMVPLKLEGGYLPEALSPFAVQHLAVLYRKGNEGAWNPSGPWVAQTDDFKGQVPAARAGLAAYVPGTNATGFGPQGGLRISVAGLGVVMRMLLGDGAVDGIRVLRSGSVAKLTAPQWQLVGQGNGANGDSLGGMVHAWGLGMQRFVDATGPGSGDRVTEAGGVTGFGHLGIAYGLQSGFVFNPKEGFGMVYAIGGVSQDPQTDKGQYSAFNTWEERTLDAVYRHVHAAPHPRTMRLGGRSTALSLPGLSVYR